MHFMTVRTENNQIFGIIVSPVAIEVRDLQHGRNAKAAMSAKRPVSFEGQFAVIIRFFHWIELMPLLFLLTPNIYYTLQVFFPFMGRMISHPTGV